MASIRRIDSIGPIPGADAIECARVGGWDVVVKRGEFAVGDLAVYCEIDSWIPNDLAPFLSKGSEPREYNGVRGERLRTVRLRGQVSQGLLLSRYIVLDRVGEIHEGQDITELLGIQKWEAPVPASLAGEVRGMFPGYIRKTDQERIQNLVDELQTWMRKLTIKDIVSNKMNIKVYSFNHASGLIELKPIVNWSEMTRKDIWVKIKMKSGKELICTKNHKIWCDDIKAYRQADQIEIGQKIILKTD